MNLYFPFLNGNEKNTLFIIGNGFDLYHGLLSKYKHFCCWLNLNGYEDFVNDMQTVFCKLNGNIDRLWCNFESALEKYDLSDIYSHYYRSPEDTLGNNKWDIANNIVADKVQDVCDKIRPLMKEWALQIRIDQAEQKIELPKESFYLTFNYTLLLEKLYGIPTNHICHIHGCVNDNELITGHDLDKGIEIFGAKSDEEEFAKQKIIKTINALKKKQKQQYIKNEPFFLSLPPLSHVVVLGHSLSDVDLYYFGKILSFPNNETIWHFSIHSDNDKMYINRFKRLCKQSRYTITEGDTVSL